ncbi:MAG: glycosyltransferase family 1 protein [Chloroflexota bacterium]
MRIVLSGSFWRQPIVGSGQYLHGLLRYLPQVAPQHEYIVLLPVVAGEVPPLPPGIGVRHVATPFDGRSRHFAKLWYEQVCVPQVAAQLKADVLHIPYAAPPLHSQVPVVTTVHDIIWLLLPEYRGKATFRAYTKLIPPAARRAAHILVDSEHSRSDIVQHLGCDTSRVTTVLLAAGDQFQPQSSEQARSYVQQKYEINPPFVYYVGGLDARKNVSTLIRAFSWMRSAGGPEATLVIAGRAPYNDPQLFPNIDVLIEGLGRQSEIRCIEVPYKDSAHLYAAATVFAFPSRYEGFGLPPLEAMACGTPTIVANRSSLPEVVGEAALSVPPDDVAGWVTALWRLLVDTKTRNDLGQHGLVRSRMFSYRRVAQETLAVYTQVYQDYS